MSIFPAHMRYGTGQTSVEISDSYRRVFENILTAVAPETTAALGQATEEIYNAARREWPVSPRDRKGRERKEYRTGERRIHSRDQLEHGLLIGKGGDEISGFVRNTAG